MIGPPVWRRVQPSIERESENASKPKHLVEKRLVESKTDKSFVIFTLKSYRCLRYGLVPEMSIQGISELLY